MRMIEIYPWKIKYDHDHTILAYSKMEHGDADNCDCSMCQNFRELRGCLYPESILRVLEDIGVNYRKECDISHVCKLENGRHLYLGGFYYVGEVEYLDEKYRPSEEIDNITVAVNETFSWHFTHILFAPNAMPDVSGDKKLIEIAFSAELPWVIDLPEPL